MSLPTPPAQPKVSVLVCTYNHEPFIEQAIESVLEQRVDFPIEVVVADDCSTDSTRQRVVQYALQRPDLIRLLLPARNIGMNPIFRQALDSARGEYIAFLDGDDFWTQPDKLSQQVRALDSHPEWVATFHDVVVFYEDNSNPPRRFDPGYTKETFGVEDAIRGCFAPTLSVVLRRELLDLVPEWVFDYTWSDWLMYIFLTQHGEMGYLKRAMGAYRVHAGGIFSSQDRSSQIEEDLRLYTRLLSELPEQYAGLIWRCLVHRRYQLAVEECGLPFDDPVIVIDDTQDMPLYLNGREAHYFPQGGVRGRAVRRSGASLREFRALCAATARSSPRTPHFRPRIVPRVSSAERRCYVIVPSTGADYLASLRKLRVHLDTEGEQLASGEWGQIMALPLPDAAPRVAAEGAVKPPLGREVIEIIGREPEESLVRGYRLEAPAQGSLTLNGSIDVVGWLVGAKVPAAEIEVARDDEALLRLPVGDERPDLAEAFPGVPMAGRSGFAGSVQLAEPRDEIELEIRGVLEDERVVPLVGIRTRAIPFDSRGPRWIQLDPAG